MKARCRKVAVRGIVGWLVLPGVIRFAAFPLLLLPVLGLSACAARPPIRLNPVAARALPRHVVRAPAKAQPPGLAAEAEPQACTSPALQRLTETRKAELFEQFEAQQGRSSTLAQLQASPSAGTAACRPVR